MPKESVSDIVIIGSPCEQLASAIVIQAAYDYCDMLEQSQYYIHNSRFMREMQALEAFFLSEEFQMLSSISGAYLLGRMQAEFENGWRGRSL